MRMSQPTERPGMVPTPSRRKFYVIAAIIAILAAVAAVFVVTRSSDTAAPRPVPPNLTAAAVAQAQPISELAVGQTRFTTSAEPEPANGQMVAIRHYSHQKDAFCLSDQTLTWDHAGGRVGPYAELNVALTRTGEKSYTAAVSPEMDQVIRRDSQPEYPTYGTNDERCISGSTVTITSAPAARAVLHLVQDLPAGGGWIDGQSVWVAAADSKTGLIYESTASTGTSFDGSTHIIRDTKGGLVIDGSRKSLYVTSQAQIDSMVSSPGIRKVTIGS